MVTYLEAELAPVKNTGQIRLHGEEGFEGMRRASRLTAMALDELVPMVEPGTTTTEIDKFLFEFGMDHGAIPATLNYRGYTQSYLHLHQPCRVPRHSWQQTAAEGEIVNIDVTYRATAGMAIPAACIRWARSSARAERLIEVTTSA
jgi:methionyl aminopeptidase